MRQRLAPRAPLYSLARLPSGRRAQTDRLDAALLLRILLGWLRGETGHCSMAMTPSIEDAGGRRRMSLIVAFARKLLIRLWRLAMGAEAPEGIAMRPA